MKKMLFLFALFIVQISMAKPLVLCDFEDYAIGDTIPLWNFYGSNAVTSSAVIKADPSNPSNKVLYVKLREWNNFVELLLPKDISGPALTNRYDYLKLKMYRPNEDPGGDWKQFKIYLGTEELYVDNGFPHQGDKERWLEKSYNLSKASSANADTLLHIGFNSDNTDFYIDNITLEGLYDSYTTFENDTLNFCASTSDYVNYSTPIFIPKEQTLTAITSRYSYWMSNIAGEGRLNIYCGGERSYLGNAKGASYPNWSQYTGEVHLYPYKKVTPSAGFYGLVLGHGGKTFNPEEVEASIADGKVNNLFENKLLVMHEESVLACESGTRGFRIGELQMEKGSRICGYYKASTPKSYFIVGCSGTDAVLAGQIAPADNNGVPYSEQTLGLVKEGAGTYRITGNKNCITGALRILKGRLLINNNAEEAKTLKLSGGTGSLSNASGTGVFVFEKAVLGGLGHIATNTDLYGTLEPGDDGIGTLRLVDYVKNQSVSLRLRPTSILNFQIQDAKNYDNIEISGAVEYYNICQDFSISEKMPKVCIQLSEGSELSVGDEFILIKASSKKALNNQEWTFRIKYPKSYTWKIEERLTDNGINLVARVTSLEYSGQGDKEDDKEEGSEDGPGGDIDYEDDFDEASDPTPLRTYAMTRDKRIGVAVPVWRIDVDNDQDAYTKVIAKEFNMVVAENEMKFDAMEPNRGEFNYYHGDRLVNFAERHQIDVRGHTLVWHSQVPAWLTADGKKNTNNFSRQELLSILEKHITNIVTHYKGRVKEWDVVNECLDDDQSIIRTNPNGYTLRPSVWATGIGEDFIDSAFVYARRADPDAKLYINDYGVEFKGKAKSEAYYNLTNRLKASGIPIDGAGLQCHFTTGELDSAALASNIKRYADINLNCIITELDITLEDPNANDALQKQALEYRTITRIVTRAPNCPNMLIWGLTDDYSWRSPQPLLYNSSIEPKPAYYSIHGVLRRLVPLSINPPLITNKPTLEEPIGIFYYNLQGIQQDKSQMDGLIIERKVYKNGTGTSNKILLNK